jgi:endoglucanase
MNKDAENFLRDLLNTPSPSGFEQSAAELFRQRVTGYADEVTHDVHGNSYATLNPKAEFKIMLDAHIDELGLMVTHIDDKGFLYIAQIGRMDNSLLLGQRIKIFNRQGPVLGVIGQKPIHLVEPEEKDKSIQMEKLWVDIGATGKTESEKLIAIGDPGVIDANYQRLQRDTFVARGCDDRVGVFIVAEIIRALAKKKLKISVVGVASVQEEVGGRGAVTSAYRVHPHAAIAFEVGHTSDYPHMDPKKHRDIKLGKGPILHRGPNINPVLEKDLINTARTLKIPHQIRAEPGATPTNANFIQLSRGGVATALVRIPNRYMHSPVEVMCHKDIDLTIKLVTAHLAGMPTRKDYRPITNMSQLKNGPGGRQQFYRS